MNSEFTLVINGSRRTTTTDDERPLLDVLREDFQLTGTKFGCGEVPRMSDVPELEIVLLNRMDLESVGGGETPIIAIAPALANAIERAPVDFVRERCRWNLVDQIRNGFLAYN